MLFVLLSGTLNPVGSKLIMLRSSPHKARCSSPEARQTVILLLDHGLVVGEALRSSQAADELSCLKATEKPLLSHALCLLYTSPSPRDA